MKRLACVMGFVGLVVMAAGCGTESSPGAVDIRLTSPVGAQLGENAFEVVVMEGAKPVVDADVSLELFMAAMPSMNMPEMRTNVPLTHAGEGRYRGTGSVAMGGAWDANVMVMRGGQHLGNTTITIVAQ